jgi:hypothetical protein
MYVKLMQIICRQIHSIATQTWYRFNTGEKARFLSCHWWTAWCPHPSTLYLVSFLTYVTASGVELEVITIFDT